MDAGTLLQIAKSRLDRQVKTLSQRIEKLAETIRYYESNSFQDLCGFLCMEIVKTKKERDELREKLSDAKGLLAELERTTQSIDIVLVLRRHFLDRGQSMLSKLPGEVLRDVGECADLESLLSVGRVLDCFVKTSMEAEALLQSAKNRLEYHIDILTRSIIWQAYGSRSCVDYYGYWYAAMAADDLAEVNYAIRSVPLVLAVRHFRSQGKLVLSKLPGDVLRDVADWVDLPSLQDIAHAISCFTEDLKKAAA